MTRSRKYHRMVEKMFREIDAYLTFYAIIRDDVPSLIERISRYKVV